MCFTLPEYFITHRWHTHPSPLLSGATLSPLRFIKMSEALTYFSSGEKNRIQGIGIANVEKVRNVVGAMCQPELH